MTTYDERHGGPYDRGSADRYYGRSFKPHYYVQATGSSPLVEECDMTVEEIAAYTAGWDEENSRKEW
jgi:hypothetical protein